MSHLNIAEAVPLGYAMVARVAHDAGVRALAIKGPTRKYGLVMRHQSSRDVDFWVHPRDLVSLRHALSSHGWRPLLDKPAGKIIDLHSETFRSVVWPCELDIHFTFPGIFLDDAEAFEEVWDRREGRHLAGTVVYSPTREVEDLIDCLHLLRDPKLNRTEIAAIKGRLLAEPDRAASLTGIAQSLRASYAIDRLDIPASRQSATSCPQDRSRRLAWDLRTQLQDRTGVAAVLHLREAHIKDWPRELWRLIWLSPEEVLKQAGHDRFAGKSRWIPLGKAYFRRWRRGLLALPRALTAVHRARNGQRHS